jgi:hypothetical protein
LVRPFLFILFLGVLARGQSLEDAVRGIARNILAPGETHHVTERSLAPEFAAETTRARTLLERALRRPTPRDARMVEVVVTATENISGPLLVVQVQKGDEQFVETAAYISQPAPPVSRPSLVSNLLWQQQEPILDLALSEGGAGDRMLVLSAARIERLKRDNGKWVEADSSPLETLAPSRDPRGRLLISEDTVTAFLSGGTCEGKWSPSLQLTCTQTAGDFPAEGEQLHFSSGENTLETANGEKFYSIARAGDFRLVAWIDGKVHGARGQQAFTISEWGSDIAHLPARCAANPMVVSSSAAAAESIAAYEITGPNPRRVSDPLPMQGWVTALWPASGGALAVVHETATGRYAAYFVSLDCGN